MAPGMHPRSAPDDQEDEVLMARYQRGDEAAFALLVTRHEARLWNFLRRYVGDPEVAQDLLQETFMRVVRGAADWQPTARFSTWMFSIARNLCTDHARRQVHRRAASLDERPGGDGREDSGPVLLDRLAGRERDGEARLRDRQTAERLDRALAALPAEQREVFLMREVMDLPFAEIAAAVGASEPTVKSRMRYALQRLRAALADLRDSGELPAQVAGEEGAR